MPRFKSAPFLLTLSLIFPAFALADPLSRAEIQDQQDCRAEARALMRVAQENLTRIERIYGRIRLVEQVLQQGMISRGSAHALAVDLAAEANTRHDGITASVISVRNLMIDEECKDALIGPALPPQLEQIVKRSYALMTTIQGIRGAIKREYHLSLKSGAAK